MVGSLAVVKRRNRSTARMFSPWKSEGGLHERRGKNGERNKGKERKSSRKVHCYLSTCLHLPSFSPFRQILVLVVFPFLSNEDWKNNIDGLLSIPTWPVNCRPICRFRYISFTIFLHQYGKTSIFTTQQVSSSLSRRLSPLSPEAHVYRI